MNDKLLHAIAGGLIAAFFMPVVGVTWAALLVVLAGVGKEVFDYFRHGKPDVLDALATFVGGGFVIGLMGVLV